VSTQTFHGVGKRKSSIARVIIKPGNGKFSINNKTLVEYFRRPTSRMVVEHALKLVEMLKKIDVQVNVIGGGLSGQAGAIRHGITRAFLVMDKEFRSPLKKAGLVTRDSRRKERKLYGQKGARAKFQFSKR